MNTTIRMAKVETEEVEASLYAEYFCVSIDLC